MTDLIRVEGLLVRAVVGVYDHERDAQRDVRIDFAVETDLRRAGETDDLADTVDYDGMSRRVHDRVAEMRPKLIETVAAAVAEVCLAHRLVTAVTVTVHKPGAIPCADSVSVTIRRERGDGPQ